MRALLLLAVVGGGVAHGPLAPLLRVGDVVPDVPLIVVLMLALRRGPEFGCVAGLVSGLLQDVSTGGLVGVQALTKALVGFAIGASGARLSVTAPLVQVPGLVLLTVAEGLARFGLLQLFRYPAPFGEVMAYQILPQALYNGFLGAAVVFVLAAAEYLRPGRSL
ncbi:MAG: rod shape-determining protein MreD [Candidatus Rokuibacteriota bacterium]